MTLAVIFFNTGLAEDFKYLRKQGMQLASKMRYIASQFSAFLADDLWKENAAHANRMATRLAEGLEDAQDVELVYPVHGNEIFVRMEEGFAECLRDDGFEFYGWPGRPGLYRLVTAHCTAESEVDEFLDAIQALDGE